MDHNKQVRVRFAPSPTGHLHIGGLRTALFNWLFARHHAGVFLLRIEDTDVERSLVQYRDSILNSFSWLGLEHDEEIVTQSERLDIYRRVAITLINEKKAYCCTCLPQDIVDRYEKNNTTYDAFVKYDGHCRDRRLNPDEITTPYVIRFALQHDADEISFNDLIKGPVSFPLEQFDDFIIIRSGGHPMYNFAVVVDDAYMNITHIIRGEEHLINTPKQILLYQACGFSLPQFAHLPLILGPSGDKLSKRDGATSVIEYRKAGYIPQALINYLSRLGWSHKDQEIFSLSELIQFFSLDAIGSKGAIFDFDKLAWVNSMYIRQSTPEYIVDQIINNLDSSFIAKLSLWNVDMITKAIGLYQERVKTLKDMMDEILLVYYGPESFSHHELQQLIAHDVKRYITLISDELSDMRDFCQADIESCIKNIATKLSVKVVVLLQIIRLALIGKTSGPGVFALLELVGKSQSLARLLLLRDTL